MNRDEAIKEAWMQILVSARAAWSEIQQDAHFWYGDDFDDIDKALQDILAHPTEFTAWID